MGAGGTRDSCCYLFESDWNRSYILYSGSAPVAAWYVHSNRFEFHPLTFSFSVVTVLATSSILVLPSTIAMATLQVPSSQLSRVLAGVICLSALAQLILRSAFDTVVSWGIDLSPAAYLLVSEVCLLSPYCRGAMLISVSQLGFIVLRWCNLPAPIHRTNLVCVIT